MSAYANPNVHMAEIMIPSYRLDVESKVDITAKYGVASEAEDDVDFDVADGIEFVVAIMAETVQCCT